MKFRFIKKIIRKLYHLIWFLSLFLMFIIPTYAVEGEIPSGIRSSDISLSGEAQFYDSNHNSLTTTFYSTPGYMPYYAVNSTSSGYLSFQLNSALVTDVLYQLVVYFGYSSRIEGSMNPVAVGTWLTGANVNNQNGSNRADIWNYTNTYNIQTPMDVTLDSSLSPRVSNLAMAFYTFSVHNDGMNYINIPFSFQYSGQQVFYGYSLTVIKGINGLKSSDVQSIINNSGLATANSVSEVQQSIQDIQQDITTSSNNIIDNQNQTSGSIITNQNENTDKQINSQKVCKLIDKSNVIINNTILEQNGSTSTSSTGYGITDYLKITSADITSLSSVSSTLPSLCFYNVNKSLISCINNNTLSANTKVNIPSNATYVRFTININTNQPQFKICTDGNQALNDSLTDDSAPDLDLDINYASDTPISDLLTMPLTILNALLTKLTDTCVNYNLPFLFNTTVTFPCFTISDYLGTNLTNYIDLFICFYMCYNIALLCINVFEDITSLRDTFDSLYEPKHAYTGYKPKHARGGAD